MNAGALMDAMLANVLESASGQFLMVPLETEYRNRIESSDDR
jgi:hypothetical protein